MLQLILLLLFLKLWMRQLKKVKQALLYGVCFGHICNYFAMLQDGWKQNKPELRGPEEGIYQTGHFFKISFLYLGEVVLDFFFPPTFEMCLVNYDLPYKYIIFILFRFS